jgi:UDP-N-acetylmuramoylalanine-D-glutamate ligase
VFASGGEDVNEVSSYLAVLDAFPGRRVALIVGGHDRGIDYTPLAAVGRQERGRPGHSADRADRRGDEAPEEATLAVHLAVTLGQWFASGAALRAAPE